MNRRIDMWLSRAPDNDAARTRLVAIPPAGGAAAFYQEWEPHLAGWIDLVAIRLPGREKRISERPYTEMAPLVSDLAEVVSAEIAAPYAILGHCAGALIGFELARALAVRHGKPPERLLVSAQAAPQLYAAPVGMHDWTLAELIGWLRGAGGTAPEVLGNLDLMRVFEPSIRADLRVLASYAYRAGDQLAVPMSVLGGSEDPDAPLRTLLAWRELTSAAVDLHTFPGDAAFAEANLDEVAAVIADDLRRPAARPAPAGPGTGGGWPGPDGGRW